MRFRALAFLAAFLLPLPLMADTTYTYTGNDFTFASSPYTTSDSITGSFTVATPLGDDLNEAFITPASFSFADGVQTLDSNNLNDFGFFLISTDASGDISNWIVSIENFATNNPDGIDTSGNPGISASDLGLLSNGAIGSTQDAGTWTSNTPSPVPEPSTLALLGTGLLGVAGVARRKFLGE